MMISRNPVPFLMRKGLVSETMQPKPRLDVSALLVHSIPLRGGATPSATVLRQLEGEPAPDRAGTRPWPSQQIVEAT